MALTTVDIDIDFNEGWMAIPCTGTIVNIVKIARSPIDCRIGIASTSTGFKMNEGDTLKVSETIYVRPHLSGVGNIATITVVKD